MYTVVSHLGFSYVFRNHNPYANPIQFVPHFQSASVLLGQNILLSILSSILFSSFPKSKNSDFHFKRWNKSCEFCLVIESHIEMRIVMKKNGMYLENVGCVINCSY
jgi:hypothetical protein